MEDLENKIIRQKIESLDGLPDGYSPSLEGKWELLEAGMENKRSKRGIAWYWSAAAVVLLSLGFIWLYSSKEDSVQQASNTRPPSVRMEKQEVPVMETEKPQVKRKSHGRHRKIKQEKPEVRMGPQILPMPEKEIPIVEVKPVEAPALAKVPPKRKARMTEIDFRDSLPPSEIMAAEVKSKTKFRVGFGSVATQSKGGATASPFRIQTKL